MDGQSLDTRGNTLDVAYQVTFTPFSKYCYFYGCRLLGLHRVIWYAVTDVSVGYSVFHAYVMNMLTVCCFEKVVPAYKNALSQKHCCLYSFCV